MKTRLKRSEMLTQRTWVLEFQLLILWSAPCSNGQHIMLEYDWRWQFLLWLKIKLSNCISISYFILLDIQDIYSIFYGTLASPTFGSACFKSAYLTKKESILKWSRNYINKATSMIINPLTLSGAYN